MRTYWAYLVVFVCSLTAALVAPHKPTLTVVLLVVGAVALVATLWFAAASRQGRQR